MPCHSCQHENPAEARFCMQCGNKLVHVCPACQYLSPREAKFCMACGASLVQESEFQSPKSKVEEAEECFLEAIEIARKQQAKSWELRATTSLARLWQQQGKQKEGHQMLSDIYNWFTEGFDTKDLQEAKALLEQLA